ncbi:hypothetical protein A0256_14895 [Mucilaginibacter sp. PAMC 26640]|nr:hypothetical protein A0256_14895 [Mucilaginibacter sp. PAMC 26640]
MKKIIFLMSAVLIAVTITSCGQNGKKNTDKSEDIKDQKQGTNDEGGAQPLAGYDLSSPVKYGMPADLQEISGIAFNDGDSKSLYAEQDEDGMIYYLHLGDKAAKSAKFAKHGDYEDIAVGNNQAVILRSDGEFHSFPLSEVASGQIKSQKVKHLMPAGEYEAMEFDKDTKKLYVLCKQCEVDKSSNNNSGYIFDLNTDGSITKTGDFNIIMKDPSDSEKSKFKFRPSAFAKNPVTKQWFILSSINKILVVADENWKVQASYPLKGFLQPEGIAFDSTGNMYISNEGDELESGNVMLFKYTGQK